MVEDVELYTDENTKSVVGVYKLGCALCGHTGIIHGGIIAMGFDDLFGTCYYKHRAAGVPGFSANLDVNYRKPMPCGQRVVFRAKVDRVEGRKVYLSGRATSEGGETHYADSTALFIAARKKQERK